ncbi:MAG: hypothetical protein GY792_23800, partial [Gammaproteobacteria bacterium]|nr:hypothetical protein [Gammaproteobacteria bacterium]
TVVGSILVAIFYITDIILYFATDGDVQLYNTVIQSISDFFYSADQLVNLTGADFAGISTSFSTEDTGIQPGSRVLIEDSFTGTIEALKGSRSLLYDAFAASEVSGSMSGDSSFGTNTPKNGSSSCTETGGFTKEEGDVMTCTNDVGVEFAFTSPHRNVPITLTYSVDAAIGYEECVLGGVIYNLACWVDTLDVDLPEDLDANQQWTPSTIYFDVLPSSVGGLWTWDELTNPDVDSDNLTDAEETALGTISDDWDSDDDDLSDGFEASIGSNPLLADTDGDGLD